MPAARKAKQATVMPSAPPEGRYTGANGRAGGAAGSVGRQRVPAARRAQQKSSPTNAKRTAVRQWWKPRVGLSPRPRLHRQKRRQGDNVGREEALPPRHANAGAEARRAQKNAASHRLPNKRMFADRQVSAPAPCAVRVTAMSPAHC